MTFVRQSAREEAHRRVEGRDLPWRLAERVEDELKESAAFQEAAIAYRATWRSLDALHGDLDAGMELCELRSASARLDDAIEELVEAAIEDARTDLDAEGVAA